MSEHQPIAVFDFDNTLIREDSLWGFLALTSGWPRVIVAFAEALTLYIGQQFMDQEKRAKIERGTFFKQQLLRRLIAGLPVEKFKRPIGNLQRKLHWNDAMRQTLQEHYQQGHHIVIASGSLDIYLPELIKELPHHALLCTTIEVVDGKATDIMSQGNCVRERKAERIASYLAAHGPFGESWGYGNFPDDVPMMNLLKHRVIV